MKESIDEEGLWRLETDECDGRNLSDVWENEDGTMWIDCDSYDMQVNFCPFTGRPACVKIGETPEVKQP